MAKHVHFQHAAFVQLSKTIDYEKSIQKLDSEKLPTNRDDDFDFRGTIRIGRFVRLNRKCVRR